MVVMGASKVIVPTPFSYVWEAIAAPKPSGRGRVSNCPSEVV